MSEWIKNESGILRIVKSRRGMCCAEYSAQDCSAKPETCCKDRILLAIDHSDYRGSRYSLVNVVLSDGCQKASESD